MDPNFIGFLILIVAMSAGIALVADRVGKKLGKKRLSIGGLRPRHTAALGTVLVGVSISIFTIVVVLLFSADIRQSLLESNKIRQQVQRDQSQLRDLELQVKERANRNSVLTNSNGTLWRRIQEATRQLQERQVRLQAAETRLKGLLARTNSLQARINALKGVVAQREAALGQSEGKLKGAVAKLRKVQLDLGTNQAELRAVESDNSQVLAKNAELVTTTDELKTKQASLLKDVDRITQDVANAQKAKETALSELSQSQTDLNDARTKLDSARSELASTENELHVVGSISKLITQASRQEPLIFKMGEEVVRAAIDPGLSFNRAQEALTNLLRRAQVEAQRRGAERHGSYASAGIFEHNDPVTGTPITTDMIEQDIVKQVVGSPTRKVLIATSSLNAFRGESVSLEVQVLPDRLVYHDGQTVAETEIHADRGNSTIYDELEKFIVDKVRNRAQKDGMIPIANGDVSFGEVRLVDLLPILQQLHNADRTIRLQAHAIGDTYASDPLKLEFRLR